MLRELWKRRPGGKELPIEDDSWWWAAGRIFLWSSFVLGLECGAARFSLGFGVLMVVLLAATSLAAYVWQSRSSDMSTNTTNVDPEVVRDEPWSGLLREYAARLPVLSGQLGDTATQVEQSVLQVCEAFSGIAMRAQESVQQSERHLRSDRESNEASFNIPEMLQTTRTMLEAMLQCMIHTSTSSMRMVYQMEEVERGMAAIIKAVGEIEHIAGRTKLLALNTTIEAARFGGQSKGFAVVAAEITKLSERSTRASETIRQLIRTVNGDIHSAYIELKVKRMKQYLSLFLTDFSLTCSWWTASLGLVG